MALCINQSGSWRNTADVCINDSGSWRNASTICINESGTWRLIGLYPGPPDGSSWCGGYLVCHDAGVYWIVSSYSAQVRRNWYSRNDAATRAQQVSGQSGWFVPNGLQLQTYGYARRQYWDAYDCQDPSTLASSYYWTSQQITTSFACVINFRNGFQQSQRQECTNFARAFRCVTY